MGGGGGGGGYWKVLMVSICWVQRSGPAVWSSSHRVLQTDDSANIVPQFKKTRRLVKTWTFY